MTSKLHLVLAAFLVTLCSGGWTAAEDDDGDGRLGLGGDFRVRYEGNSAVDDGPERHRGVLRFRLGATFRINDRLQVGARLATGDPGNPRTTDVTMDDFVDDLEVSLDRAYLHAALPRAVAWAGKHPNPFITTELVWDGDVSPVGLTGTMHGGDVGGFTPRLTGALMIVDEQTIGDDSTMWGGQVGLERQRAAWGLDVGIAYWDYHIASLTAAEDPGDRRGNLLTPDGSAYLSDFDLTDVVMAVTMPGPTVGMPIRVVVDYVKNLGAAADEDEGFGVDVSLGLAWTEGRPLFRYGYAQCETDAVLGAFSHDNLPLATNYRGHTLRAEYGVLPDTSLSLTWYYFKELDGRADAADASGYRSRVRLDLMVRF